MDVGLGGMSTGMVEEQNLERQIQKQMGCVAGFFQIFDRHQILTGKRRYSAKRLPPPSVSDTASESEELGQASVEIWERPIKCAVAEAADDSPYKSSLPVELREVTRSPWKFGKESPRLSLDSRATTDAKGGLHPRDIRTGGSIISPAGAASSRRCESMSSDATDESQQHRSPGVIARLMGLEQFPDSYASEPETKPQLRRSASESRVCRDLFQSGFTVDKPLQSQYHLPQHAANDGPLVSAHYADFRNYTPRGAHNGEPPRRFDSSSPWKSPQLHHRGFFDSRDFFPDYEIENRLRFRGIDEPSRDLDTLKQILEALQLKGLLHSRKPPENYHVRNMNFVYDEPPVVTRPPRLSNASLINKRRGNDSFPPSGRYQTTGVTRTYGIAGYNSQALAPRQKRNVRSPNRPNLCPSPSSTAVTRTERDAIERRSNSPVKPKPPKIETQRKNNESIENRRVSPVPSPKPRRRRTGLDPKTTSHSPRRIKSTAELNQKEKFTTVDSAEDESSCISGSSITTSTDTEKSKAEDCKEGRHLLDRCDNLLHSIADMTAADMQPSPVSVLDSSFYKDESSSTPSPVTTRHNINFKDRSNEGWTREATPEKSSEFSYISDILRASSSHHLLGETTFLLLEEQQCLEGKHPSESSMLQRKLIFDAINEILDRDRRLPPWKWKLVRSIDPHDAMANVWSELERIQAQERGEDRDLFGTVCGVLRKDLLGDDVEGWDECHVEVSGAVLDIERLVFKDVVTETIWDLATSSPQVVLPRRKLVF